MWADGARINRLVRELVLTETAICPFAGKIENGMRQGVVFLTKWKTVQFCWKMER